ncbi:hypothetical protein ABT160_36995 [Streptomyces sp. NPDC001941]|uniref:hypothetical protein n=1 Tax=Streptomyces sp. NPDC001941 TaxID=3154659 RepID=UPI003324B670
MPRTVVTGAALAAALLLTTASAHATTSSVSGQTGGTYTYYDNPRTVTAAGSNIYLKASAQGIGLTVMWYKCGDRSVHGQGVDVSLNTRKLIGSNFRAGTVFCLAAVADVVVDSHHTKVPWSGSLQWNVFS